MERNAPVSASSDQAGTSHAADQAGQPGPSKPVKKWPFWRIVKYLFWLIVLVGLGLAANWLWHESREAEFQADFFHRLAAKARFTVEPGPSTALRFPQESPYDERLGYSNMPTFLQRLQSRDYAIIKQARMSPGMLDLIDRGAFAPYHEKTRVGLQITDCRQDLLFQSRFPERVYSDFKAMPPLLVQSLLFIENRELLDPTYPKRNPAVEWERFSKAVFDQLRHSLQPEKRSAGGSTLATQIEKYRHSAEGRTNGARDKLRQMVSASLRAYQDSEDTTLARQRIVLDYVNTVPLSAKPGFGEVNGIGDGLWVWYGRDFAEVNQLLQAKQVDPAMALAYKQTLSIFIAQRRPTYYLGDPNSDLNALTDAHLRLLAKVKLISPALRDAALLQKLQVQPNVVRNSAASSFVTRKASTVVRTHLAGLLGDNRLYNLDRLDLSLQSTLDAKAQEAVGQVLRDLHQPGSAKAAGLQGKGLLGNGDPAQVVYSVTLLERGEHANFLRIQTDNYDQPLDINDGAKLDLGSTAKLRTLITYLDVIANLHARYVVMDSEQLKQVVVDRKDVLSRWVLDYLLENEKAGLSQTVNAALERKYSSSTGEGFFTGGGMHYFGNFNKKDDGRFMTLREGMRHSVNLVFVRLLRDVVHYYMFQTPGSSATLLSNVDDPRRAHYLSRFADREGSAFMTRFYSKYRGKDPDQAKAILLQSIRPTPARLTSIFRTIYPEGTLAQFDNFIRDNLASQNQVSVDTLARLYMQFAPENMSLADRGYLAHIHPLEMWLVGYLRKHPKASLSQVLQASSQERQQVYTWLFNTHRKHAQDKRIVGLLEVEGFLEIHRQWKRMGYPFDSLVPSYATALGASADRPSALAEMMGILINQGVRKPVQRIQSLHFAADTPYETLLQRKPTAGEQVLAPEVAEAVNSVIREVVAQGTARRVNDAFVRADGSTIEVSGKTGTGDQRFDVYGAGGRLIESRFVNRSATFVFNIGQQYYGSITAYVHGPKAEHYDFTSALPVQLLKNLAPSLMRIIEPDSGSACRAIQAPQSSTESGTGRADVRQK
jgi:membrane peptidoglycan carboxypeptidase